MIEPNIATDQAAECLRILRAADRFLTAAEIAVKLGIAGTHETQRRHVRALVKQLRDQGEMIIANNCNGYFLTKDIKIWDDYVNGRAIEAKTMLAEVSSRKKIIDRAGQHLLFDNRVRTGVATMGA